MKLSVTESLILLCLDDQTGKFRTMPLRTFDFALAGAIMAELVHNELIVLKDDQIELFPSVKPLAEKELVRSLTLLREVDGPDLEKVISRLAANADEYSALILERLVANEILRKDEEDFLWIFHSERYETLDLSEELAVRERLRRLILDPSAHPSREECVLIALIDVCNLGSLMFSHAELERVKDRILVLTSHDSISNTIRETVRELQNFAVQYQNYPGF